MSITTETRWESFEKIQHSTLPQMILEVLEQAKNLCYGALTAREIAEILQEKGYSRNGERQTTAPRLTELVDAGKVKVVGKVKDKNTNRNVATFMLA